MRRFAVLPVTGLATLIAVATIAAAAACGSAGTNADTQASPAATQAAATTPTPQEFVSRRYGFRITLTKPWSEVDASVDWDGKELQGIGSPAFANFEDSANGRALVAAAAPLAAGTRLAGWRAAMVRAAPSVCSDTSAAKKTTLGGEPALTWTASCSDGYDVNKLVALHGKRGYMIFFPSNASNDDAVDRRIFESICRSFRFTG